MLVEEVCEQKARQITPLIYALEPRLLFDGDLGADVASAIVYRDGNNDAMFTKLRL